MPAPLTPAERLSRFRQSLPAETQIAEALSLAVRVEPALLRDVRLILFPRSKASLEADLYFSPLVSQRTMDWITLDPQLSLELQSGLTEPLKRAGAYRDRILQAREAIVRVHRQVPFEITIEEEVIWLAVRRQGGRSRARAAIDARLRELLMRMLRASEESVSLARWFASAAHRMPLLARETEAFSVLAFATSSTLGGRKIEMQPNPSLATFEALARYLPESAKRIALWMGLTTRGVHILPSPAPGYERVEAPLTNPVLLEVRGGNTVRRLVQVTPGQAAFIPLSAENIVIRSLLRDTLNFRPRAQRVESATAHATTPRIGNIYISYDHIDIHDRDFVLKLTRDLQSRGYVVWLDVMELKAGVEWAEELHNAIENSGCMMVVVRPSPSQTRVGSGEDSLSEWIRRELKFALDRGKPIIPILRSGDAGLLPYELRSLNFVDFRVNVPYDQAFEILVRALTYWEIARAGKGELVGVPPLPEHFPSRPEIMRQLEDLTYGRERIIALVGRPGIGKSTLALTYAHAAATREAFPGGIVWVDAVEEHDLRRRSLQKQPHLFIADVRNSDEMNRLSSVMGEQSRTLVTAREWSYTEKARVIDMDRPRVIASYSHRDKTWFDRLSKFLYQPKVDVDAWDETRIVSDEKQLSDAIRHARVAVILVSVDYLASDIIVQVQLPLLMEAAKRGELRVVWIAISPTRWLGTPLANFQAANNPDKPLNFLSPSEQDRELARIIRTIADAVAAPSPDTA